MAESSNNVAAAGDKDAKPSTWMPTGKDGVLLMLLLGGTVGGYKLVDTRVESTVATKVTDQLDNRSERLSELVAKLEVLTRRVDQTDAAYEALQADRMRDLRTGYEKIGGITASIEALGRQIADVRANIDAAERRSAEADRDLRREIADLRSEVNTALRQPLVGPKGR